ncbi:MAG: methyltransferase domain-containing protein [Methylophilaceae bacterium]
MSIDIDWFNTTAGQYLLQKEQALFDQAVFDLFGFNALQMGGLHHNLLSNSRIPHQFLATHDATTTLKHDLCCQDDFLPFAEMSLDLLLLPHRLEFSESPHQTLREAARVVVHEGHLLISGFNPMSAWGLNAKRKHWQSKNPIYPWNGQYIGLARIKDWLTLLGFEVMMVKMTAHTPPFQQVSWHQRFIFMDKLGARCCRSFGGVYFIIAKKRVIGLIPIKPQWKTAPLTVGLAVRQPKSHTSQSEQIDV